MMGETVHIRYKVGTISQILYNVNLNELRNRLQTLLAKYDAQHVQILGEVLWVGKQQQQEFQELEIPILPFSEEEKPATMHIEAHAPTLEVEPENLNFVNGIVNQLVVTDNLTLDRSVQCGNFFKNWWQSKTNVDTIICLLDAAVDARIKDKQNEVDAKLREWSLTTTTKTPSSTTSDAAKIWLENWNRQHGIVTK